MKNRRITRKGYEEYLNEIGKSLSEENFWIGGKLRKDFTKYGYYIRKYDPINFEVGFNEYCNNY